MRLISPVDASYSKLIATLPVDILCLRAISHNFAFLVKNLAIRYCTVHTFSQRDNLNGRIIV